VTEGFTDGNTLGADDGLVLILTLGTDDGVKDGVSLGTDDGKLDAKALGAPDGVELGATEMDGLELAK